MKNKSIPKGLIPLEDRFDENDVARNMKVIPKNGEVDVDPKV